MNEFSFDVRSGAVRLALDDEGDHPSRCVTATSIAAMSGVSPHTPVDWVKKVERDSGPAPGFPRYAAT